MFDRRLDIRVYVTYDVMLSVRVRVDVMVKVCLKVGMTLVFM